MKKFYLATVSHNSFGGKSEQSIVADSVAKVLSDLDDNHSRAGLILPQWTNITIETVEAKNEESAENIFRSMQENHDYFPKSYAVWSDSFEPLEVGGEGEEKEDFHFFDAVVFFKK